MIVSSLALAVAPKCPFCLLSYFGSFGAAAVIAPSYRAWLPPLTVIWLALTVGALAFRSRGRRRYGPALLGLLAGCTIFGGKFIIENPTPVYIGIAALLGAAVWRAWPRPSPAQQHCTPCAGPPLLHEGKPERIGLTEWPPAGGS
jgi:hypothetical protein